MKFIKYKVLGFAVLMSLNLFSQTENKREMRATWVATVSNIDWPKSADRGNAAAQKADLMAMLDLYKSININAIFLQVRPECDALYNSAFEPWSRYLTYTQGEDPGYDPLRFAIDEAHKRGIELHAWVNPYRINASTSDGGNYYDASHVYVKHPDWAIEYDGGKKILNPGKPEVMSYIGTVIGDMLSNYNVDGVHFDDYFYAYGGTPSGLDATEYAAYGGGMSLADWRRDNVNRMIDTVYRVIQETNPNVRFGVSPFGIYRPGTPSGIIGMDAYNTIYCDPLAWLEDGNIDYLTPQQYWPTGGGQDFESLTNWWSDQLFSYGRHYYPGQGTYRLSDNPGLKKSGTPENSLHEYKQYFNQFLNAEGELQNLSMLEQSAKKATTDPVAAWTLSQLGTQIDMIRSNVAKNALGSVFFSAKDFTRVIGLADYMVENKYTQKAIIPEMTWKSAGTPTAPSNITTNKQDITYYLNWDHTASSNDRYVIYASDEALSAGQIIADPANIQDISFEKEVPLPELMISANTSLVLTTVNAVGKESPAGSIVQLSHVPLIELLTPSKDSKVSSTDLLTWQSDYTNPNYQVQVSRSKTFSKIIYSSDQITATQMDIASLDLEGGLSYYWRVKAESSNEEGPLSAPGTFITGFPGSQTLLVPANLSQNISSNPLVKWTATESGTQIRIIISENSSFDILVADESFDGSLGEGLLTTKLDKSKWYFIKIQGTNSFGTGKFSNSNTFKTSAGTIPDITLDAPATSSTVASFDKLQWSTTTTEGSISFNLEIAADEYFSSVLKSTEWIAENEYFIEDLGLEGQRNYYWRVRAKSEFGTSEFTDPWEFTTGYPTRPTITAPGHLSSGNSVQPTVSWTADLDTDSVYVEFSEESTFNTISAAQKFPVSPANGMLSTASLKAYTWYFVRLRAKNEYGSGIFSANKYFETGETNAIFEMDRDELVQIYPGLLREGDLHIQIKTTILTELRIDIFDISGRNLISKERSGVQAGIEEIVKIGSDEFPYSGIYFIKIESENGMDVKRIMVVHQ
jgi:uncharacterized lipoprotein YddW (UPF0748 family)